MSGAVAPEMTALASRVRMAVLDVDGVLTNGQLLLGPDGEELKQFHVRDGHGLVMLREAGFHIAIITGRSSPVVARRMEELGISCVYQGQRDKLAALAALERELAIAPGEICYVGDDLPDVPPMLRVGLPIAVADAHPAVRAIARYLTQLPGGAGAVREVCELLLEAQGKLAPLLAAYGLACSGG